MIENPKNANISNKVKNQFWIPSFCVFCLVPPLPPPSSSVWFELGFLGTEVRQSSPTQRSGIQFNWFCLDGGRLLILGLFLGPVRCGRGQMRVSWCQRLDGRMLSTFSMMKFRGANSVLRNCTDTETCDFKSQHQFIKEKLSDSNFLRLISQLKSNRRSQTKSTQSTETSSELPAPQAPPGLVLRCVLATASEEEEETGGVGVGVIEVPDKSGDRSVYLRRPCLRLHVRSWSLTAASHIVSHISVPASKSTSK